MPCMLGVGSPSCVKLSCEWGVNLAGGATVARSGPVPAQVAASGGTAG
jgi:hypothetical protein